MLNVIDSESVAWVHSDFNFYYVKDLAASRLHKSGGSVNLYLNDKSDLNPRTGLNFEIKNITLKSIIGVFLRGEEVVFLCATRKSYLMVFLMLMRCRVSLVMHKYHFNVLLASITHRAIFNLFGILGLRLLFQDEPLSLPVRTQVGVDLVNPFRALIADQHEPPKGLEGCTRIILVGSDEPAKQFHRAHDLAVRTDAKLVQVVDEGGSYFLLANTHIPVGKYSPMQGDIVWGDYSEISYKGVQSGIPFFSVRHGLKIISNSPSNFVKLIEVSPDFTLSSKNV